MKKFKLWLCFFVAACALEFAHGHAFANSNANLKAVAEGLQTNSQADKKTKEELIALYRKRIEQRFSYEKEAWKKSKQGEELNRDEVDRCGRDFELALDLNDDCFDLVKLKPEVDKFYGTMKKLIEQSGDCPVESFDDFIVDYMTKSGGQMHCVNRQEFEHFCTHPEDKNAKITHLYRGIDEQRFVDSFRSGNIYIGGRPTNDEFFYNSCTRGIYTSKEREYSEGFTHKYETFPAGTCHFRTGSIIDLAVDEAKIKTVSSAKLDLLLMAFFYYYPETCNAYKIWSKNGDFWLFNSYPFEIYNNAFKKVFGSDLIDLPEICGCARELDDFSKDAGEDIFLSSSSSGLYFRDMVTNSLVAYNSDYSREIENQMQNVKKPHFSNKEAAILGDKGLLAKLFGYDVFLEESFSSVYVVVNPGVLTVCCEGNENEKKTFEQCVEDWENRNRGD